MRWGQASHLWNKWDDAIAAGRGPADFLREISDESLIQLLLTCPAEKEHERDIVATEAFNRMVQTRRRLEKVTKIVSEMADRLDEAVARARPAIHETEQIAKREKRGEVQMMEPEQAIEVAHHASARIEDVVALMEDAQSAAKSLREFRDWRMRTARDEFDAP